MKGLPDREIAFKLLMTERCVVCLSQDPVQAVEIGSAVLKTSPVIPWKSTVVVCNACVWLFRPARIPEESCEQENRVGYNSELD